MRKKLIVLSIVSLLSLLLLVFSCTRNNRTVIRIASNIPESLELTSFINSIQDKWLLHLTPIADETNADILITDYYTAQGLVDRLDSNPIADADLMNESYHPSFFEMAKDHPFWKKLTILSFQLAGLVSDFDLFSNETVVTNGSLDLRSIIPGLSTHRDAIGTEIQEFEDVLKQAFLNPFYDPSIFFNYLSSLEVFQLDESEIPSWQEGFFAVIFKNWQTYLEDLENIDDSQNFSSRYSYVLPNENIHSNRIDASFISTEAFLKEQLYSHSPLLYTNLRVLESALAMDPILVVGRFSSSTVKQEANDFLRLLFSMDFQASLLDYFHTAPEKSHMFFGGFSSLQIINKILLESYYPQLSSQSYPNDTILIGQPLGESWPQLLEEIIHPWFLQRIFQIESAVQNDSLFSREDFESWEEELAQSIIRWKQLQIQN